MSEVGKWNQGKSKTLEAVSPEKKARRDSGEASGGSAGSARLGSRFIELRLKGLGFNEAQKASGLSGSTWSRWRDYINKRLEEAGLKKAEKNLKDMKRGVEEAEEVIKRAVGEVPEGERTECMEVMDQLVAEVEHARRILPKIAYGFIEPKVAEKTEAAKVEEKVMKKPEEKAGERPREVKPEPMLVPVKEIRYPDGMVGVQYSLGPDYYKTVRQTDAVVDRIAPVIVEELRGVRSDVSSMGNRLLTLMENYWGPQLKKVQPWSYFPIPITQRTTEQRERELEAYEKQIAEKAKTEGREE